MLASDPVVAEIQTPSRPAAAAVLGTPGYMAPEQAAGRRDVSVAADVHGLGAVLYELLTGRVPFKAESQMEALLQVLERDPPTPRSVNRALDPDTWKRSA